VDDVVFSDNGLHGDAAATAAASLNCSAQAKFPAAWYRLRPVPDKAGRQD